ncbi:MAG: bifunctional glutamate N-acetyltransferase/amino-acid acetyltransferase ArgJ [Acidiferrobacterales bacterium]
MPVGLNAMPRLLPVKGLQVSGVAARLRYKARPDLVLMACDEHAVTSAVFTTNRFAAAPVIVAKKYLATHSPRALLINAGQANAGTGQPGIEVAEHCAASVASKLGCAPQQVLPFSTGVIGVAPSVEKIDAALPELVTELDEDNWEVAANGIMTTDTQAKGASHQIELQGKTVTITGIVKGSGMIHPNMATMLAFVATDVAIDKPVLDECWREVTAKTFNRVTVDGDTSTNDAALIIATGQAENPSITSVTSGDYLELRDALLSVCAMLAQSIVRDGEGATKFVTVTVSGGVSEQDCLDIAFTVAHSPLVKTALFASDPNWGRILAAAGRAPVSSLDMDKVDLYLDEVCVASGGAIDPEYTEEKGQSVMSQEEFEIRILLHAGEAEASVWTSDLSHEYIRINAEYRS